MNSQKTKTKFVKKGCSNYKAISLCRTMKTNLLLRRGNLYLCPCSSTLSKNALSMLCSKFLWLFFLCMNIKTPWALLQMLMAALVMLPSSCIGCQLMSQC